MLGGAGHGNLRALFIIGAGLRLGPDLGCVRPGFLNLLWRNAAAKKKKTGGGASQA
jgi:hypothetical protein